MSNTFTAHRVTRAGSTPTYIYRGVRITNSAGTSWGRGWIYQMWETRTRFASTLRGAKASIDFYMDKKSNV